MSFKAKIDNCKRGNLRFFLYEIKCDKNIISLAKALKGSSVTGLDLSSHRISCNGLKHLAEILGDTQIARLTLIFAGIQNKGLKYLTEVLPNTQITQLDFSFNNLDCNGLKYLTQVLSRTKITHLILNNTEIKDEGIKYLADVLTCTEIKHLNLSGNKIGFNAAQYLTKKLVDTKVVYWLDIWHFDSFFRFHGENFFMKCISVANTKDTKITLYNEVGIKGARYLKNFKKMGITELIFYGRALPADDVKYLAKVFENIQVRKLFLAGPKIIRRQPRFLAHLIKHRQIAELTIKNVEKAADVQLLVELLRDVKIFVLNLHNSLFGDDLIQHLAPVIRNSDIMELNLSFNKIGAIGAKYLAEILLDSKIMSLDLKVNCLRNEGVKYLVGSLPRSQVTKIYLDANEIENEGYQYLINVVDDTNLTVVSLSRNNIAARLENEFEVTIPRSTVPIADKICDTFEKLVSFDPATKLLDFTVPICLVDMSEYAFLIKALIIDNPNSKVHIFKRMCTKFCVGWDFDLLTKINEFISEMPSKFNTFFNSKLVELIQLLGNYDFSDLVKQFEDMKQFGIVQNLLFHRVLFYVDEKQDILNPYIYKMLHNFKEPLYNEQLEPNKREEIISFYQSHAEINGAQEIIDLLASLGN